MGGLRTSAIASGSEASLSDELISERRAEAKDSGGTVSFVGATFSDGTVGFGDATFSGGTVSFGDATFSGGTVDLSRPVDWSVPPSHLPPSAPGLLLPKGRGAVSD